MALEPFDCERFTDSPSLLSVSSILPSLVRLAIPFLRRSSAPSTGSVTDLIDLTNVENQNVLDLDKAQKAFLSFRTYIKHVKSKIPLVSNHHSPEQEGMKEFLSEGYIRGFYVACQAKEVDGSDVDYQQVARNCLTGLRVISPHLSSVSIGSLERNIVSAIFGDTSIPTHRFFSTLFTRSRALNARLRTHHLQRPGQKGTSNVAPLVDPVRSNEEEVMDMLSLLEDFFLLVAGFETLSGGSKQPEKQTKKAMRERIEGDRNRPGRIAIETLIARAELTMALASLDMSEIKRRAMRCHLLPVSAGTEDVNSDTETADEVREDSDDQEAERDVKPILHEPVDVDTLKGEEADAGGDTDQRDTTASSIEWEIQAEICLLQCLRNASFLLKSRHPRALSEVVRWSDWIGGEGNDETHRKQPGREVDSEEEHDHDSESDSTTSGSVSPDEPDVGGTARPAPLRAIFRLQDRYEELRLAVWLSLPTESRGKMSAFMRGIPTHAQVQAMRDSGMTEEQVAERRMGQIGRAWDELGLLLLKDFDP